MIKYEYNIQNKYNKSNNLNMRIDGIKDKLYERKHSVKF